MLYHGLKIPAATEARATRPECPLEILTVGRWSEKKGFLDLIEALALVRDAGVPFRLQIIAGDGSPDYERRVREAIEARQLDGHVRITDWLPSDEVEAAMRASDLFVLPCLRPANGAMDGIPNVLIEALSVRLPVVATRLSGIPELIRDGKTGLLVDERDPQELATTLQWCATHRGDLAPLADAGRRLVERTFDIAHTISALERHFEAAIAAGHAEHEASGARSRRRTRGSYSGTYRVRPTAEVDVKHSILVPILGLAVSVLAAPYAPSLAQVATPRPPRNPRVTPQVVTATHFVRPDGSSTSFCSANEPCSLPRAVALIGSANMRPGSIVLLQHGSDGVYSQGPLTFEGSGTAEEPIRFIGENNVRHHGHPNLYPRRTVVPRPRPRVHVSRSVGRRGQLRGRQRGAASSGHDLAADSRGRSPAAVHAVARAAVHARLPDPVTRRERRSTRWRRSTARSGTIDRTTSCMCTCATTAHRRTPTTCIWAPRDGAA